MPSLEARDLPAGRHRHCPAPQSTLVIARTYSFILLHAARSLVLRARARVRLAFVTAAISSVSEIERSRAIRASSGCGQTLAPPGIALTRETRWRRCGSWGAQRGSTALYTVQYSRKFLLERSRVSTVKPL